MKDNEIALSDCTKITVGCSVSPFSFYRMGDEMDAYFPVQ